MTQGRIIEHARWNLFNTNVKTVADDNDSFCTERRIARFLRCDFDPVFNTNSLHILGAPWAPSLVLSVEFQWDRVTWLAGQF